QLEKADWSQQSETALQNALEQLDERSKEILQTRWLAEEKATLQELADKYHVSAERIRQLEKNAMQKLREAIEHSSKARSFITVLRLEVSIIEVTSRFRIIL